MRVFAIGPSVVARRIADRLDRVPITYEIDRSRGILRVRVEGTPSLEEEKAIYARYTADPEYRPGMPILVDDRGREGAAESDEVRSLARESTAPGVVLAGVRMAILVASDVQFGMSRMFELLAQEHGIDVRVFRDEDEALAWLGGG